MDASRATHLMLDAATPLGGIDRVSMVEWATSRHKEPDDEHLTQDHRRPDRAVGQG